ncbi:MAG: tRNA-dihydrouridine synthase family protein, partial [Desulfobacteraceae bacterium]|nr:tRNA-dihydrouridine synthase family protein [Desulfobacteraceae bacterium]
LGRMAVARPWIFAQWTKGIVFENSIYHATAIRMASLLEQHYDMPFSLKLFKKFAPYFCANFKFSHFLLKQLNQARTMEELKDNIHSLLDPCPDILSTPNRNFFV